MTLKEWLFGRQEQNIPVVGVHKAGKTYFLLSLAHMVSERGWGQVKGREGHTYLQNFISDVVNDDKEIPATMENTEITIEINRIETEHVRRDCNLLISTEDFSGGDFEKAMESIDDSSDLTEGDTGEFLELYQNSQGLIVIVDVVRGEVGNFQEDPEGYALSAMSEQLVPLASALDMTIKKGVSMANSPSIEGKPIFIVFTKSDIHQMSAQELFEQFNQLAAITVQRLESNNCELIPHVTSAIGWGEGKDGDGPEDLEASGFTDLLVDMAIQFD